MEESERCWRSVALLSPFEWLLGAHLVLIIAIARVRFVVEPVENQKDGLLILRIQFQIVHQIVLQVANLDHDHVPLRRIHLVVLEKLVESDYVIESVLGESLVRSLV